MRPAHPKQPSRSESIHALLVDDHPAVRHGLALLLASEDIVVCGEAAGRAEALACFKKRRPELAIVDLSLDGEDGTAVIADLRERGVPVLAYSMHQDPRHVQDAIAAGALVALNFKLPKRRFLALQHKDRAPTRAERALLALVDDQTPPGARRTRSGG